MKYVASDYLEILQGITSVVSFSIIIIFQNIFGVCNFSFFMSNICTFDKKIYAIFKGLM